MKMTLHVTDALGRKLSVETTLSELDTTMRALSTIGATSGDLLGSGLTLPYENEGDFDWALIGARPWTNPEGEVGVFWQGSFYKRREFAAKTTGVKMPAAIKYSRGARPTDRPDITEGDGDSVRYVTLVLFKGGKRQEAWAKRGSAPERQQATQPAPAAAEPAVTAESARSAYAALTKGTRYYSADGVAEVLAACLNSLYPDRSDNPATMKEAFERQDKTLTTLILNTARAWIAEDDAQAVAS